MPMTGINIQQNLKGRTFAKMKRIIILIMLVFVQLAWGATPTIDWYDVDDWELQVCNKWGGVDELNDGTTTGEVYLSEMVITLQAQKVVFQIDETNYTTQYKIGWYFAPYQDDYIYGVRLAAPNDIWFAKDEAVSQGSGKSGFNAFYENETVYSEAVLEYCRDDYSSCGSLTVPVIE